MCNLILTHFPFLIPYLPQKYKQNKKFLWPIIDKNTESFQYVDDSLKNDSAFIFSFFIDIKKEVEHQSKFNVIYQKRKRHYLYEYCSINLKNNREFLLHLLVLAEKEQNEKILYALPSQYFHSLEFWIDFLALSPCRNWNLSFYKKALSKSFSLQNIKRKNSDGLNECLLDFFDLDWMKQQAEKQRLERVIENAKEGKKIKI